MSGIDYGGSRTRAAIEDAMMRASGKESNYERLFGTPERAARTLVDNCGKSHFCEGCPADTGIHDCTYDALLEWLKGASDGE